MTGNAGLIQHMVGSEYVNEDAETLSLYAVDGMTPSMVVFPGTTQDVARVVQWAAGEGMAVMPWGSGSKGSLGHVPERLDMVISMSRLNRIIDVDTANLTVTVEAGVRFRDVQAGLAGQENRCYLPFLEGGRMAGQPKCSERDHKGCFVPMSPPYTDSATFGGILAANSTGPTRLLYGSPRDLLLGIRYVTPAGDIVGVGGKTVKNVSGYDMCKLMIGSLGTLGVLCELTLRLLPLPESMETCLATFKDRAQACGLVKGILGSCLLPAAVEILNPQACQYLSVPGADTMEEGEYSVAVALEGIEESVVRMSRDLHGLALKSGGRDWTYLEEEQDRRLWQDYSNLPSRLHGAYPDLLSLKLQYPLSHVEEILEGAEGLARKNQLTQVLRSHGGSGVTLIHLLLDPDQREEARDRICAGVNELLERCLSLGGNLVVESAGRSLKDRLPVWGRVKEDFQVMKRIKEAMDPKRLFSPGRFVGGI